MCRKVAQRPIAHGVVIRIEKIAERRMKGPIAIHVLRQHESLEEPCRVRQVPLGGTGIRHGLQSCDLPQIGERTCAARSRARSDIAPAETTPGLALSAGQRMRIGWCWHDWLRHGIPVRCRKCHGGYCLNVGSAMTPSRLKKRCARAQEGYKFSQAETIGASGCCMTPCSWSYLRSSRPSTGRQDGGSTLRPGRLGA